MNHALPTAAPDDCAGDRAGRPETRGIDQVPIAERHGRARELFAIWAAPNVSYLSFVIGATLVLMGLSPVQAIGVALVGNLLWILTGVVAISGPAAGTSGSVVSRAMYGVLGNRIVLVLTGWLIASAYLALNWSAASVAGIGLARRLGLPLLGRFAELGVVASLQPAHATRHTRGDGTDNWSRRVGPDRAAHGWRTRDLVDHHAVVALGSDWPIGPGDPRVGLADCQLRRPVDEPGSTPVHPEQALSAREAYAGMTLAAAHAGGAGHELGRVAPGYLADLTILAANPLDLAPEAQADNAVLATIVDGDVRLHTDLPKGRS